MSVFWYHTIQYILNDNEHCEPRRQRYYITEEVFVSFTQTFAADKKPENYTYYLSEEAAYN